MNESTKKILVGVLLAVAVALAVWSGVKALAPPPTREVFNIGDQTPKDTAVTPAAPQAPASNSVQDGGAPADAAAAGSGNR